MREFLRSGLAEQTVTLRAPDRCDADDYDCPGEPQTVRLIRHVAPNGAVRVLMTNLMDPTRFPASAFGDLYHQRWRIEEAFKRLKHRLSLEHVTGLSQQAVEQDVAAKILCDNLQALTAAAAHTEAKLSDKCPNQPRLCPHGPQALATRIAARQIGGQAVERAAESACPQDPQPQKRSVKTPQTRTKTA